jgi:hypothetical protein
VLKVRNGLRRRVLLTGAVLVSVAGSVTVGATAFAAPTTQTSVLKACVSNKDGAMRLVSATAYKCPSGQRLVKWNVVGPAGPRGATGPQGSPGADGAAGQAGTITFSDFRADEDMANHFYFRVHLAGFTPDSVVEVSWPQGTGIQEPLVMTQPDGSAQFAASSDCRRESSTITVRGKGFKVAATVDARAAGLCAGIPVAPPGSLEPTPTPSTTSQP